MKFKLEALKSDIIEKTANEVSEGARKKILDIFELLYESHFPIFDCLEIESVEADEKKNPLKVEFSSFGPYKLDETEFSLELIIKGNKILLTDDRSVFAFEETPEMRKVTFRYDNDYIRVIGKKTTECENDDSKRTKEYIEKNGGYYSIDVELFVDACPSDDIADLDGGKHPLEPDFKNSTKADTTYDIKYSFIGELFATLNGYRLLDNYRFEKELDIFIKWGIMYRNYIYKKELEIYEPVTKTL